MKAVELKDRVAAQRAQLQVRHWDVLLSVSISELLICRSNARRACLVTLEDVPFDRLWTHLKGFPHLCLKPGLRIPPTLLVIDQAVRMLLPSSTPVALRRH